MNWDIRTDRPIHLQLTDQMKVRILCGFYRPGERVPPVRELAAEAGVNPNTMQRSLLDLEREGLLYTQRTNGRFVTDNEELLTQARQGLAQEEIRSFFGRMNRLGLGANEAVYMAARAAKHLTAEEEE